MTGSRDTTQEAEVHVLTTSDIEQEISSLHRDVSSKFDDEDSWKYERLEELEIELRTRKRSK
jgi:hypothetical protein